ncbi:MAG: response regulator, partial [Lachnospiraceae bacterium]|nr:response regulator [Lachnospiraceae bacterium]
VYGLTHRMGGFVRIESEVGEGTTVRVTIPQKIVDKTPCLRIDRNRSDDILLHIHSDKYKVARVRDFYNTMAVRLAREIGVPLYSAETVTDIQRMMKERNVSHIFMGEEEYKENSAFFDRLSRDGTVTVVSAEAGFIPNKGSHVLVMPKPLYAYPIIRILNEGDDIGNLTPEETELSMLKGVKVLVVDDESMNLVVATGLFQDYGMEVETASGGMESIEKFRKGDYDIIFMDHMMPEMDGVEAMHRIREISRDQHKPVLIMALTANVVSGAREMFVQEGFDGFIAKPINLADFERVMMRAFSDRKIVSED